MLPRVSPPASALRTAPARSRCWPIRSRVPSSWCSRATCFRCAPPGRCTGARRPHEAAVDLTILAGLPPSGVLCELINDDGTVQRLPELTEFKRKFGLRLVSIAQLIEYRAQRDHLVELVCAQPFPSEFGDFTMHVFRSRLDGRHHLALALGTLDPSRRWCGYTAKTC